MAAPSLINKTCLTDSIGDGLIFDINIEDPDHYNDVTRSGGTRVDKLDHDCFFNGTKIGTWIKTWVESNKLKGKLQLEPEGSSAHIDEIRTLVKCGAIRAVRATFKPIRSKPREGGGTEFTEQSLLTVSLVAFGRNPAALVKAKVAGVSTKAIRELFREQNKNASLAERIQDARFSVRMHNDERNKPQLNKIYSAKEKDEINRRAEQILLGAGYEISPKKKTIASYVKEQLNDQATTHAKQPLAKAKAMIAKWEKEKALKKERLEQEQKQRDKARDEAARVLRTREKYQGTYWGGEDHFVEFGGHKIPKSKWRG